MLFLLILILSFICSYFLPWWMAAVVAFLVALLLRKKTSLPFLAGFGAIFICWMILALLKSIPNENMLASEVVQLFPLPHNWVWVLVVTSFIGGLIGGFGAMSGSLLRKAIAK
jgi:hypothetical protein